MRVIPQLDQWPWAIRLAQTKTGQTLLAGLLVTVLTGVKGALPLALLVLLLVAVIPRPSHLALAIFTVICFLDDSSHQFVPTNWSSLVGSGVGTRFFFRSFGALGLDYETVGAKALVLTFAVGLFVVFRASRSVVFGSSALLGLICAVIALIFLAHGTFLDLATVTVIWFVITLFNRRLFLGTAYLFLHRRELLTKPFYWWIPPVAGGSLAGKSHAFIDRFRAVDAEALARHRLSALKLALWVLLASVALRLLGYLVGKPGYSFTWTLPTFITTSDLVTFYRGFLAGDRPALGPIWWSVFLTFWLDLLAWTVILNVPVILIRFFGFRIPRGVYKPLSANSIPEFFARRFYYFKELLFDLFVSPLFMKLGFIRRRRLRLFVAVTVGVGTGSALSHLLLEVPFIQTVNGIEIVYVYIPMIIRGFLFGAIFGLYQFGNPLPVRPGPWYFPMRALNLTIIILFFSLSKLFAPVMLTEDPWSGMRFLKYLFFGSAA